MGRTVQELPPCHCGCKEIEIAEDKDLGGLVIYCKECGAFPERSFVNASSARRGWKNFVKQVRSQL